MIKRPTKSQTHTRPSWAVNSSYLIPVFFILAFAGVGVSLLYGGHAATPCVEQTLQTGESGNCVLQAQKILDVTATQWGGTRVAQNGSYDAETETQVKTFQSSQVNHLNLFTDNVISGVVNESTWRALCYADNVWHGNESAFNGAGCQTVFGVDWDGTYSATPWTSQ